MPMPLQRVLPHAGAAAAPLHRKGPRASPPARRPSPHHSPLPHCRRPRASGHPGRERGRGRRVAALHGRGASAGPVAAAWHPPGHHRRGPVSLPCPAPPRPRRHACHAPCAAALRIPDRVAKKQTGLPVACREALRASGHQPSVRYVTGYSYLGGAQCPAPAVLPREYVGRPHAYLEKLNHGRLPYIDSEQGRRRL